MAKAPRGRRPFRLSPRTCRQCRRTDDRADADAGDCSWVEADLCSACEMRRVATILARIPDIEFCVDAAGVFALIGQIQLVCRHPGNVGRSRTWAEGFARELQNCLAVHSPELGRLVERGWHAVFDVPRAGGRT